MMTKKEDYLLIAKGEFTPQCSSIRTPVSLHCVIGEGQQVDAVAIWDTGASRSGVSQRIVDLLGLKKSVDVLERYADGKVRKLKAYLIGLKFPSGRKAHTVATAHKAKDIDFIIGMDLIRQGTFILEPMDDDGGVRFLFVLKEPIL